VIVCTAGHIDHGKTALVRALTGVDADRLAEEKARGITIDLGFAYWPLADGTVLGFIDVPGHERFIHNMLAGVSGIDFALLVVAADDGVMPQTVEHVQILDLLGLCRGAVALTKADLAGAERLDAVTGEIADLLAPTALAGAPVVPVSSPTGLGIDRIAALLADAAQDTPERGGGWFRLAVDRAFTVAGAGVVVTGTVFSGEVAVGEHLRLSPSGREVRVRAIHAQNRPAERGHAGQRCALNLAAAQLAKDEIPRGEWVLAPPLHRPALRFDARFRLLGGEKKPLAHWTPVHLHAAAAHTTGRIALLEGDRLAPGENALVQLVLDHPVGLLHGDRFILRDQSARRTLGGGRVIDVAPPGRGRRTPARLARLAAAEAADPRAALPALLALAPGWVDLPDFALQRNLPPAELAAVLEGLPLVVAGHAGREIAFAPTIWQDLRERLTAALARHHAEWPDQPGLQAPRLRPAVEPGLPPAVFAPLLEVELAAGTVVADGPWYRLAGHTVSLTPAEEALWARIEPRLDGAEQFRPPRVRDLGRELGAAEDDVRKLMKRLARMGKLVLVAQDHYFLRPAVAGMVALARTCAEESVDGSFAAASFRDRTGSGRKVAIQCLEFFDRMGVTLRKGDLRRLREERCALFGSPE